MVPQFTQRALPCVTPVPSALKNLGYRLRIQARSRTCQMRSTSWKDAGRWLESGMKRIAGNSTRPLGHLRNQ
jgi:hypothetical protein